MKLTRLRLHGFKSFVEPTDFMIEPGLTGVVGPNGCGKSNLVEALRFVMGETSHKSLRGGDMDAVIFSGSGNRPARNHAEVTMTIDNAERSAPAAFNEYDALDISRRIEREQGSAYRINGRDVRARDIQIMFADAASSIRAESAKSFRPSHRSAAACSKMPPASPAFTPAVTKPNCVCAPPKPISPASRT